jgi:hypothetical protein
LSFFSVPLKGSQYTGLCQILFLLPFFLFFLFFLFSFDANGKAASQCQPTKKLGRFYTRPRAAVQHAAARGAPATTPRHISTPAAAAAAAGRLV